MGLYYDVKYIQGNFGNRDILLLTNNKQETHGMPTFYGHI